MSQSTVSDGRSRRWDGHKEQRRNQILDAAIEAIDTTGVDVPVREIADRSGLPRPVVYRHFKDRSDLDEQVRSRILALLMVDLRRALTPEGTVREAIENGVSVYVTWADQHPRLHRFLGIGLDKPAVSDARSEITNALGGLFVVAGASTDAARPLAYGIIGLIDGMVSSWRARPTIGSAEIVRLVTDSVTAVVVANAAVHGLPVGPDTSVGAVLNTSAV